MSIFSFNKRTGKVSTIKTSTNDTTVSFWLHKVIKKDVWQTIRDNITLLNSLKKSIDHIFVTDCIILGTGVRRFYSKLVNRLSYRGKSASSTLRCQTCLHFKCSCPASMETKGRRTNITGSFFAGYDKGGVSCTSDFRGRDVDGTDSSIPPCWVASCTCATFSDRKGARWLSPQLLPVSISGKTVFSSAAWLWNVRAVTYTEDSSAIKFSRRL